MKREITIIIIIPPDIRSNSYLEKYNKIIKDYFGDKKDVNWVLFLGFINNEIIRTNEILNQN